MTRYLFIAVTETAKVVNVATLLGVALVFASLLVPDDGGSLLGAVVVSLAALAVNYGAIQPIGRYAARALGKTSA